MLSPSKNPLTPALRRSEGFIFAQFAQVIKADKPQELHYLRKEACPVRAIAFDRAGRIVAAGCAAARGNLRLCLLLKQLGNLNDNLYGFQHNIYRSVLEFAVEIFAPGKNVRSRESHVGEL